MFNIMEVIMNKFTKTKLALLVLAGLGTAAPIVAMESNLDREFSSWIALCEKAARKEFDNLPKRFSLDNNEEALRSCLNDVTTTNQSVKETIFGTKQPTAFDRYVLSPIRSFRSSLQYNPGPAGCLLDCTVYCGTKLYQFGNRAYNSKQFAGLCKYLKDNIEWDLGIDFFS